ncbi:PLDc N-terminal domain-containing protein [Leucobacter weissii]|uniref:PLDc N-terminal domain-containing protein n=1 Tax=Leucobacter weissii TaxID=1983706 RepID=A0A939MJ93_9MICO|nr:PLDc N-terminal domain-containing protein [Leucobacter weissii]MBO1901576.1 PLDc N-terminal domain-containing protein [Leucobacter weissii]
MVRFVIIGAVIAVAFTLYALVDAAMTDANRARGVPKPVWVVIVVLLPVIGGILWLAIGKGRGPLPTPRSAPDDDPGFSGTRMSDAELDEHVRELEDRLRELDSETFPGEDRPKGAERPARGSGDEPDADAAESGIDNGTEADDQRPEPK